MRVMRVFFIHIFLFMACIAGQGQGLSLEISVEWRKTESKLNIPPIKADSLMVLPFLKLVYRNLTREDIYFKNLFDTEIKYPSVVLASLINTQMDLADRAKVHAKYGSETFKVEIGEVWEVLTLNFDFSKEHENPIVNDDLFNIYEVLETQELLNALGVDKQLSCFNYSGKEIVSYRESQRLIFKVREKKKLVKSLEVDFPNRPLTQDEITGEYSNRFIFLKRGKTYEQKIDLIGFYIIGGSFEFLITNTFLPGYLVRRDRQKVNLPKVVNGHTLYNGVFLTNTLGIKIN